jgi:2-polyprenyl-3-methyl-5-hydroxy-6-metoxy-1,4-benzoquinol methylase
VECGIAPGWICRWYANCLRSPPITELHPAGHAPKSIASFHPTTQTFPHKDDKMEDQAILFDQLAHDAAETWDKQIAAGRYIRGEMFLNAVKSSVYPSGYILDYGCGPGRISALLARNGFRVLGRDPSPGMLAMAKQQSLEGLAVEFQLCSFSSTELPPETYDGIVCSSVIEYVPDPAGFLRMLHPALRPNGVLIISFANGNSIPRFLYNFDIRDRYATARKQTWSWRTFRQLLESTGFACNQSPRYFYGFPDISGKLPILPKLAIWGSLGVVIARKE